MLALGLGTGVAGLFLLGLPSVMGSAPRGQEWSAPAGEVRVVDGETLRLSDRVVRLSGLDAPPRGQPCQDASGRAFDCGAASAEGLARLVSGRGVRCQVQGRDTHGRALGLCITGPEGSGAVELNGALVSAGWALGQGKLASLEAPARTSGRGLWAVGTLGPQGWHDRR